MTDTDAKANDKKKHIVLREFMVTPATFPADIIEPTPMKISNIVVATSFVWLLVSFWSRNNLPHNIDYIPQMLNEPAQTSTETKPFDVNYNGVDYRVFPEYEYDLYGTIVSFRHHDGDRIHMLANDHLNMLDVCVIWGNNTSNRLLHKIDFWNGIFTCNVKTSDQEAWDSFDMYQLSNNHLISDDDFLRDQVRGIQIGDQIRVRGYLASYSSDKGGLRGTSTTRLDTGNGACETVYVQNFDIIQAATSYWRISMYSSLVLLICGLFAHFRRPYRPFK